MERLRTDEFAMYGKYIGWDGGGKEKGYTRRPWLQLCNRTILECQSKSSMMELELFQPFILPPLEFDVQAVKVNLYSSRKTRRQWEVGYWYNDSNLQPNKNVRWRPQAIHPSHLYLPSLPHSAIIIRRVTYLMASTQKGGKKYTYISGRFWVSGSPKT